MVDHRVDPGHALMYPQPMRSWKTTALGIAGATLGSLATVANLDQMTSTQVAVAFGVCLFTAIQGFLTADAKPKPLPIAPTTTCPTCGK